MRLLLRCDGGPGIGVGHVVRSIALAQEATARGHEVSLLGRLEGEFLHDLAAGVGPGLTLLGPSPSDAPRDLAAAAVGFDALHVDHYDVPGGLLDALSAAGPAVGNRARPVLSVMADGAYGAQDADLLVDATVESQWAPPPAAAGWHLRGARFVALRRSVTDLRRPVDGPGSAEAAAVAGPVRVLVVMGGTDPRGCAPLVLDALAATGRSLDVTVVASADTAPLLAARAQSWQRGSVHVTPPVADLPTLMAGADLVVTAAGTSVWELCAMARPMAVVAVVDNQRPGYDALVRAGGAVGLGAPDDLAQTDAVATRLEPALSDPDLRTHLAERAGRLVDGRGAWRLVASLEAVLAGATPGRGAGTVVARPATMDDAELLWHWRNDPDTRANSRSHAVVPLEAHLGWLGDSLGRPDRHLLVGERDGSPVGTVRWDLEEDGEWEVSITVAPHSRGQRLAGPLLAAGEDWLRATTRNGWRPPDAEGAGHRHAGPAAYLASVHRDNAASRRLFLAAGYLPDLPPDGDGFERFVKVPTPGPR